MAKTVLVVDDDETTARMLASLIRASGYQAHTAYGGAAALHWLGDSKPDLIVLDMMMPEMDGLTVVRALRADVRLNDVPAIIFSAIVDEKFQQYALQEGAKECWQKGNFDYRALSQNLARIIGPAVESNREAQKG
jgi:CheY-like chemotaxis protein